MAKQLGSLMQCNIVSEGSSSDDDVFGTFSKDKTWKDKCLHIEGSIRSATTVKVTGRGGFPIYHTNHISDCEVLQPVGRWKFRFYKKEKTESSNASQRQKSVRLSPIRFVEAELRVGTVVVDCFRRQDIVTLHSRQGGTLTLSIAEVGSNQLAIIAILLHVPTDIHRAVGLFANGDTASLDHLIHYLHYKAPDAKFQFWSIGVPSSIMSQVLYSNLIQLPGGQQMDNTKHDSIKGDILNNNSTGTSRKGTLISSKLCGNRTDSMEADESMKDL